MTLDLDSFSSDARAALVKVGKRFGSEDTLAQAEQTLTALAAHGVKLSDAGFNGEDTQDLTDAKQFLIDAGVGRESARAGKKETSKAYVDALKQGKATRLRALSVLGGARRGLLRAGAKEGVNAIDAVTTQVGTAADDATALATQLDVMGKALARPDVAAATATRGGTKALTDLGTSAAALRAVSQDAAAVPGTPEHTQRLDLLDGIVVGLCRDARRAARTAAKELGDAALAKEFELTKLYGPVKAKAGEEPKTKTPTP